MTIGIAQGPSGCLDILRNDVSAWLGNAASRSLADVASKLTGRNIKVAGAYPYYNGKCSAMLAGKLLADAERTGVTGWGYVITEDDQLQGVAELEKIDGLLSFAALYPPAYASALVQAMHHAEAIDAENAAVQYELRILRAPSLSLSAVWLQSGGKGKDVLVPIHPTAAALRSQRQFDEATLMDRLTELAKRRSYNERG